MVGRHKVFLNQSLGLMDVGETLLLISVDKLALPGLNWTHLTLDKQEDEMNSVLHKDATTADV